MDTTLIAKVRVPKANKKYAIGTAYPIRHDLLLTARHVVEFDDRDATKPIEILWNDLDHKTELEIKDIIYIGKGENDVALLKCDSMPSKAQESLIVLAKEYPPTKTEWESMGYPIIGKESGDHHKVSAIGESFSHDQSRSTIDLTSESDAKVKGNWKGISGAPVFICNEHKLLGVISSTPEAFNGRLTAILMPYLLEHDANFREKSGYDDLHKIDFSVPIASLQSNNTLFSRINVSLKDENITTESSPADMVNTLQKLPIPTLIKLVRNTQRKVHDKRLYSELGKFLLEMLPKIFDVSYAEKIRQERSDQVGNIVSIPYATDISAEMLMACSDNRRAAFKIIPISSKQGSQLQITPDDYLLSKPPESGSKGIAQQQRDINYDLYTRFKGDAKATQRDITNYLYDEYVPQFGAPETEEDYIKEEVQDFLKNEMEEGNPSYYWIMRLPSDEKEKSKLLDLAKFLKKDFPQASLLILGAGRKRRRVESNNNKIISNTQIPKETP